MIIPGVTTKVEHKEDVVAALKYVADILGRRARGTTNAEVTAHRDGDRPRAEFWEGKETAFDEAVEFVMWYIDQHLPEDEREGYESPNDMDIPAVKEAPQ